MTIIINNRVATEPYMSDLPAVLITGASSGIGATYADRLARRGHDLVIVARDKARLDALAERLVAETGVSIDVIQADLTQEADLSVVEARLRDDARIGVLVNNAGLSIAGRFDRQASPDLARLVAVNTTAVLRLAHAVSPRFVEAGQAPSSMWARSSAWSRSSARRSMAPRRPSSFSCLKGWRSNLAPRGFMSRRSCQPRQAPKSGAGPAQIRRNCRP